MIITAPNFIFTRNSVFHALFASTILMISCARVQSENILYADKDLARVCIVFSETTNSAEKLMSARSIASIITRKIDEEGQAISCAMVKEALGTPDYGTKKDDCFLEYEIPNAEDGCDYCLRFDGASPWRIKYARVYLKSTDYLEDAPAVTKLPLITSPDGPRCCSNHKDDICREALMENWRLSERDNRAFEHYSSFFLSDAPVTDGHFCIFSRLADLTYVGETFQSGPMCNEHGDDLWNFPEREGEGDVLFDKLKPILDQRRNTLEKCYEKYLAQHPTSCFYWSFHHKNYLSGPMFDAIFRHVSARRPRSNDFARHLLLDLYNAGPRANTLADLDSGTTNAIPFEAMYDFWRTNRVYVLSYRDDPFMIVEADDGKRFKDVKMPSPMSLVLASCRAVENTIGTNREFQCQKGE